MNGYWLMLKKTKALLGKTRNGQTTGEKVARIFNTLAIAEILISV